MCHWGNRPCFGYQNHQEMQEFCDGPKVENLFKSNGYWWDYDQRLDYHGRTYL